MVRKITKEINEGDPDERYVRSRVEDRSVFAQISYWMDVYKPVLWLISLIAVAAGFGFSTPSQKFDEVRAGQKAMKDSMQAEINILKIRQDASLNDRMDQRKMIEFLGRERCSQMSTVEKERLGGIEVCEAVFNPTKHALQAGIRAPGEPIR